MPLASDAKRFANIPRNIRRRRRCERENGMQREVFGYSGEA
jgi:hypothetical protein